MKIHFMGILGSGCSAVAAIAKAQGDEVSGCDTAKESEYGQELAKSGIDPIVGHSPEHILGTDILVISPAICHFDDQNPELIGAKNRGIPVKTWQEFSGDILQEDKFVIAVCGTHGKSTTTALTALILEKARLDPTVHLGAIVPSWQANYRVGKSKYFIVEADEYGNNFLSYSPDILAITNVEYDHPEFFRTEPDFVAAFQKFVTKLKPNGTLLLGEEVKKLPALENGVTIKTQPLSLAIPGTFNRANASMALAIADQLAVDHTLATTVVTTFAGLARRFELVGEVNGTKIFDDYGHHPTAIAKTAQAARDLYGGATIWLVFQPHMFTRTKALLDDFVAVFKAIPLDHVILADIYPSREHDTGIISSRDIVEKVDKPTVAYGGTLVEIGKNLAKRVKYGDVVICMGAGDITTLSRQLVKDFNE